MVGKRGEEKYYLIISLILGLMVLTLSLYFIFNEYFTKDELDWQACRQSIILRTNLPEADLKLLKYDVKGAFPLKCKTEVVNIDSAENSKEVFEKISESIAEGWYMFGEGEFDFIHRNFWTDNSVCMVFARLHYTPKAYEDYVKNNNWEDEFGYHPFGQKEFIDYYNSAFVGNTKGTYGEYLPISLAGETAVGGNLFVNWANVSFVPTEDSGDLFLVYRINKFSSIVRTAAGFIPDFVNPLNSNAKAQTYESYRSLVLTTPDELDKIGCDRYLSIPA